MIKIAPSLLAAKWSDLANQLQKVAEADYLHLDVMDGHFVPNITFGPNLAQAVRELSPIPLDVHLMVTHPDGLIPLYAPYAEFISVHVETCPHLDRTLSLIRSYGVRPAVVLNPATPLAWIELILEQVEMVLLMTVNPGFGGQRFIPYTVEKVELLRRMAQQRHPDLIIEVDGGIDLTNAPLVTQAGASMLVAGTAVFGADDPGLAIRHLRGA